MRMRPASSGAHGKIAIRHGLAVVEFAIIVPFLLLLIIGMVEMTRAIQVKNTLTDAVRTGCRLAIQPGTKNAAVQATMNTILTNAGFPLSSATLTIQVNGKDVDAGTAVKGDQVSVKVAFPVNDVGWLITPIFFSSKSIESETLIMMRQG